MQQKAEKNTRVLIRGGSRRSSPFSVMMRPLNIATLLIALTVAMPLIALIVIAASGTTESITNIANTILPVSTKITVLLLLGVGLLTAIIGTMCAWLVSFFEFPGRKIFSWALMLPLAVPTYIAAYSFVEFFSFTGPIQEIIRMIGGYTSIKQYWFPEIRTLPGTIFTLSLVLYPYVYISVRALFHFQSARLIETARVLGVKQFPIFLRVLLPLARPAIVLGVTLAMMETINDIGAIEYLGIQTLTFSIFSVWLNQNDIAGAAQLALILLLIAFLLILFERWARRGRSFAENRMSSSKTRYTRMKLEGQSGRVAAFACVLPIVIGFGIPLSVLADYAISYYPFGLDGDLLEALITSLVFASLAAVITVLLALVLTYAVRKSDSGLIAFAVRIASVGYAIPGTIIALGIFLPIAMFDNYMDGVFRQTFGISTGLLITGSGATIIYAYTVRFMAMAEGSLDGGFKKIPTQLDSAARSLGRTSSGTLYEVLLPLMRPAVATAALLVFVDSIKELSATIMLRPFGINTLATHVYDFASRARIEEAGFASLIIVAAGIIPVILITKTALDGD
ncbi:MAG: iron ABC transporter permease [Hyphomicrobiales bacterium]|nr:MAG: iron ABC transporter permease [Hyphomicrobiales bacterium]